VANNNDLLIIEKVLQGDRNAFAILVDNYKDMAVSLAFNILLNQEDAEEVAQDAFVKAYKALAAFKRQSKFSTWFYRIVVTTALNKKKLKKHPLVSIENSTGELLGISDNGVPELIGKANRQHVLQALKTLGDNERTCIALYYLDELSIEEIKSITGITTSNIKVLLHRGRKNMYMALQQLLKKEITDLI